MEMKMHRFIRSKAPQLAVLSILGVILLAAPAAAIPIITFNRVIPSA